MTSRNHYTPSEAVEIKQLLDQRFRANRNEQKRIRARLHALGFHISDFEIGLTPAGFDALTARRLISVGSVAQAARPIPAAYAAPDSSAVG